jgi:hypothetical protein
LWKKDKKIFQILYYALFFLRMGGLSESQKKDRIKNKIDQKYNEFKDSLSLVSQIQHLKKRRRFF